MFWEIIFLYRIEDAVDVHFEKGGKGLTPHHGINTVGSTPHPVDAANWFSFMTFSWISPFMFSSYRHGLNPSRIPFISNLESSQLNTDRLEEIWLAGVKKGKGSAKNKTRFGQIIWSYVRRRVFLTSFVYLTSVLIGFITPTLCMRQLLRFSANPDASLREGAFWVLLLIISEFTRVLLFTLTWALGYRYVKAHDTRFQN